MKALRIARLLAAPAALVVLLALPAAAQPFDPGPPGTVTGSSMAGQRIGNYRGVQRPVTLPNAPVFGDTVEERTYGRDYDNSYLRPRVRQPDADGTSTRLRAAQGRSTIRPDTAGDFARSDPSVLNQSGATRPIAAPRRARIVPSRP